MGYAMWASGLLGKRKTMTHRTIVPAGTVKDAVEPSRLTIAPQNSRSLGRTNCGAAPIPAPARPCLPVTLPGAADTAAWISPAGGQARTYSATSAAIFGDDASFPGAVDLDDFLKRFVHPDDRPLVAQADRALRAESRSYDIRFRAYRKDGALRRLRETAAPIIESGGGSKYIVGNLIDVTNQAQSDHDLREARQHASRADRAKSLFLANMSHEFRTPLNAIIGFSQIMETEIHGPLGDPRYRGYVSDIKESGLHLLQLINDVLNLSTSDSDEPRLIEEDTEVGQVVDQALRETEPLPNGSLPTVRILDKPLRIKADVRMLKRALGHLLENAIKFSGDAPVVRLTAGRLTDGSTFVSVEDHGIGMTDEEVTLALQPFGQNGSVSGHQPHGSGLGLPYADTIMGRHQGTLEVRSAPRRGTTVTLRFPPQRSLS
jgi:signal transduction histidine kinase